MLCYNNICFILLIFVTFEKYSPLNYFILFCVSLKKIIFNIDINFRSIYKLCNMIKVNFELHTCLPFFHSNLHPYLIGQNTLLYLSPIILYPLSMSNCKFVMCFTKKMSSFFLLYFSTCFQHCSSGHEKCNQDVTHYKMA